MILFLDTTQSTIFIRLYDLRGKLIDEVVWQSHFNQTEELLSIIDNLISKSGQDKFDLKKILVVRGPGLFTGVRIGVTTANFLGLSFNIPVIGLDQEEPIDFFSLINRETDHHFSKPVLPRYDRGANITKSRKL